MNPKREMIAEQDDFHLRYMRARIEEFNELRKQGKRTLRVRIEEVERIMMENYSLHVTIRMQAQRLSDMAMHSFIQRVDS